MSVPSCLYLFPYTSASILIPKVWQKIITICQQKANMPPLSTVTIVSTASNSIIVDLIIGTVGLSDWLCAPAPLSLKYACKYSGCNCSYLKREHLVNDTNWNKGDNTTVEEQLWCLLQSDSMQVSARVPDFFFFFQTWLNFKHPYQSLCWLKTLADYFNYPGQSAWMFTGVWGDL